MVEKDVEFAIKQAIDIKTSSHITITNEYRSDGIVRIDGKPVGILELKYKRNFTNEKTRAQIYASFFVIIVNQQIKKKYPLVRIFSLFWVMKMSSIF